jgi:hypothetical protein
MKTMCKVLSVYLILSPIRYVYLLAIYLEDFTNNYYNAGPPQYTHKNFVLIIKSQRSQKTVGINVFLTVFVWWLKDPEPDPDSYLLTNGSGCGTGKPENIWIYGSDPDPQHSSKSDCLFLEISARQDIIQMACLQDKIFVQMACCFFLFVTVSASVNAKSRKE